MYSIKKLILAGLLTAFAFCSYPQSINTYSPYSRFGIGVIPTHGFAFNKAMGGISQALRNSYSINYLNPATYAVRDTLSFLLDFGVESSSTRFEGYNQSTSQTDKSSSSTGGIHHFALSFPLAKRWGAAFGVVPFSNVGYKIIRFESNPVVLSEIGRVRYYHTGRGGINQMFLGSAIEPVKNLLVGVNMLYYFGSLDYNNDVVFPSTATNYANGYNKESIIVKDVAFSLGFQYNLVLNKEDKSGIVVGATFDNKTKLNAKRKITTTLESSSFIDTLFSNKDIEGVIDLPAKISAGIAYNHKNKLITAIEYTQQDWIKATLLDEDKSLAKMQIFRFGMELTPNRSDLKSYLKRVHYRVGGHYTKSYLVVDDYQLKGYGISFGVGFPFRNNTRFNVSFEFGSQGKTEKKLVKENYGVLNLSLSFYDFGWFVKRKYN